MRKAIVLGIFGWLLASSAAFAEGGCDWGAIHSASSGSDQTIASDAATTKAPIKKETKG